MISPPYLSASANAALLLRPLISPLPHCLSFPRYKLISSGISFGIEVTRDEKFVQEARIVSMLDLNLNVKSAESTHYSDSASFMEEDKYQCHRLLPEASGTSSSSVVNADASSNEDSCSTRAHTGDAANNKNVLSGGTNTVACPFNFDILKVGGGGGNEDGEDDVVVTKDFFPLSCGKQNSPVAYGCPVGGNPPGNWIDLTVERQQEIPSGGGSGGPVRVIPQASQQVKKSRRGPRSRSSQYRGVTFYRRTGRWESHIWDCGKQVYLGGFDTAHAAARAYDRAAIKFRGVDADINFSLADYDEDMNQMKNLTKEEFVHILRRQSTGFSRGSSKFRGVTLHKCGRWEARMGQFLGKKAYDKAAIKCNGREAVTNFEPCTYDGEMLSETRTEGTGHNLDLNLGISPPFACASKENAGHLPFHSGPPDTRDKSSQVENPMGKMAGDPRFKGFVRTSDHSIPLNSAYTTFFPTEERATTEKMIEQHLQQQASSHGLPRSWAWQMHGQQVTAATTTAPMALFSTTTAASSGFSTSATLLHRPPPRSTNPSTPFHHNMAAAAAAAGHGFGFVPSPTAMAANGSQFYYSMKPPQAPTI
ncbi:unnamed protein product [Linum tenue]|uniref:AP2/ERF domain-containing protein n=1 Tax=Linum tenue TaxID=586396 RepID=A0AAV0QM25_9ROSI|nr:unnamed protein product [Linum tenue]